MLLYAIYIAPQVDRPSTTHPSIHPFTGEPFRLLLLPASLCMDDGATSGQMNEWLLGMDLLDQDKEDEVTRIRRVGGLFIPNKVINGADPVHPESSNGGR